MLSLDALFPDGVMMAECEPSFTGSSTFIEETCYVANAREKRRHEFLAGRACARTAMAKLGLPAVAIPAAPDRTPVWPAGIVGSISHCETLCIAAVAKVSDGYASLGLDIEPAEALPGDILDIVCTGPEQSWLRCQPEAHRGLLARLIFSAKECAYKCQYPLTRTLIDFNAFQIGVGNGTFTATFTEPVGRFATGDILQGRFRLSSAYIVCAMALDTGFETRALTQDQNMELL